MSRPNGLKIPTGRGSREIPAVLIPMTRTRKILLSAGLAGVAIFALSCVWFTRPTVRANRLCRDAGFGRLPASVCDLRLERRGPPFTTQRLYLRFQTTAAEASAFFDRGRIDPNNEPAAMQAIGFGVKSPSWMRWSDSVNGRVYLIPKGNVSVWLALDDDSHTIYLAVFESRPTWLRRLLERCGLP